MDDQREYSYYIIHTIIIYYYLKKFDYKLIKFLIKMNSITQKIQDVYVLYNLCDKNISETLKLTKTIKK